MGIKGLNKFLQKRAPDVFTLVHISDYSYMKVAVDATLYMFKYKAACGERWLDAFVELVSTLRKNNVHPVFVFDGGSPPEKIAEQKSRSSHKKKLTDKLSALERGLADYDHTGTPSQELLDICNKRQDRLTRLLAPEEPEFDPIMIKREMSRLKSQIITIRKEDILLVKDLLQLMGVPHFVAPLEAEKACSHLCCTGHVSAVLTEDTDVLAYGVPAFLSKMNLHSGICTQIKIEEVLLALQMDRSQFVDFCIMCGTDYNKNVPGVGPEGSFRHITQYGSIDSIPNVDVSLLNHPAGRRLFSFGDEDISEYSHVVKYCSRLSSELEYFLFENNSKVNVPRLERFFQPVLVFEEEANESERLTQLD